MSNNFPKLPDILDAFHQEHWHLTKLLVLLSIIAIISLGSLSLAQHLLPQGPLVTTTPEPTYTDGVCDANPTQWQSKYIPIPSDIATPSSIPSTTFGAIPNSSSVPHKAATAQHNSKTAFAGSAPSTNAEMVFVSSTHSQSSAKPTPPAKPTTPTPPPAPTLTPTPTPTAPANWYTYGFTDDDIKYAEACAAQFIFDYHTFDYANPASLQTPVYMLSAKAKKLFYLGGTDDTHNIHLHMLSTWQTNTLQKNQLSQQATIEQPTLSSITPAYSNYIIQAEVRYKLVKQINSQVQPPEVHQDTVILQNAAPSPKLLPNEQHGWEVVDWIDDDA